MVQTKDVQVLATVQASNLYAFKLGGVVAITLAGRNSALSERRLGFVVGVEHAGDRVLIAIQDFGRNLLKPYPFRDFSPLPFRTSFEFRRLLAGGFDAPFLFHHRFHEGRPCPFGRSMNSVEVKPVLP